MDSIMPEASDATVGTCRRDVAPARPRSIREDGKALSEQAVRAIEEGRADHAAGRTFTLAEIKKEPGIAPGGPGRDPE